jgi:hypothetical protein
MPAILDHLVVVAPTLAEGRTWVEDLLGVAMFPGGRHNELGTHNALLRIGDDIFLEVIALDPEADHDGPRVFGIGDPRAARADWEAGRRLRTWVARTADGVGIEGLDAVLADHGSLLGVARRVTRNERVWRMSIPAGGALPLGGAAPTVVDYEPGMVPARRMPETGCALLGLTIATPDPDALRNLLERLDLQGPVEVVPGPEVGLTARIATPRGEVALA